MSTPKRLHDLYEALSFDERLRLALDALHSGRKQDQQLVETLPSMDREAWSDCFRLLDTTNSSLAWYIDHLQMAVTQTELRCALWLALERSATNAEAALLTLLGESSEPVTESEHAERVAEARAEHVPLDTLAELMVDEQSEDGELNEEQWDKAHKAALAALKQQVKLGTFELQRSKGTVLVSQGSFDDWRETASTGIPDWGRGFEVLPDSDLERVAELREERNRRRLHFGSGYEKASSQARECFTSLQQQLATTWHETRVVERALEELTDDFAGHDPLFPDYREELEDCHDRIQRLSEELRPFSEMELTEPPEEKVDHLVTMLREATTVV